MSSRRSNRPRRKAADEVRVEVEVAERLLTAHRPPSRRDLDEESERRARRRSLAAAAAARAGGALSLTAVLLGAPSVALAAPTISALPAAGAPAVAASAVER